MTTARLKVLKYFLSGKRNGVGFFELLNFLFAGSYFRKANAMIENMTEGSVMNSISIKRIDTPLICPKIMTADTLRQVIVESMYPDNWHYYEIPQTAVTKDDVVADCGAAEGLFSLLIAHRCRKLFLIEPLPDFVNCLEKTFASFENTEILACAISDAETTATLSPNGISSSLHRDDHGINVTVRTLDQLFFEKGIPVSYIKMDLEGYDFLALKGAEKLIRRNKPKIAVTTYHHADHYSQISSLLKSLVPEYNILSKGIFQETGNPVMLHAWI